jgi:hypothetical protein
MSDYKHPEVKATAERVAAHLKDPKLRLIEVDVDTTSHDQGHIPGAVSRNWKTRLRDEMKMPDRFTLMFGALVGVVVLLTASAAFTDPSIYPTGTTIYDPQKAYNSYVVFGGSDGKTHLIDMNGNEVHRWERVGQPSEILDPAITGGKKGELLVDDPSLGAPLTGIGGHDLPIAAVAKSPRSVTVGELDWDGNTVWEWGGKQAPGGAARQNHDWDRLPNGNTLIVATVDRVVPSLSQKKVSDQVIYEITPSGDIVWKWYAADHVPEFGFTPEGLRQLRAFLANGNVGYGFLTINDMQHIGPNKWFDGGDKRFDPDNIVVDSREGSFIAIIEKKTGKIVWRVGPDYPTNQGPQLRPILSVNVPRPVDQTSGQHDAHIIPEGLPGAGDILVFDNEGASGFPATRLGIFQGSRVLEIDPTTKQIVWQYTALDSDSPTWDFNSSFISSARRLPNGNTLIDEGTNGRFFQVTPKGEIVWEYVSPYFGRLAFVEGQEFSTNFVYRAQPVPYDWVPEGTPHSEKAIPAVDVKTFRVPGSE